MLVVFYEPLAALPADHVLPVGAMLPYEHPAARPGEHECCQTNKEYGIKKTNRESKRYVNI